ncbi:DUF2787 family protein [Vibrio parahaemolyticus]|nr:DUF2787 family protein [Vibrio parahaemolyticus]
MLTLQQQLPFSIPSKLVEFISRHVQKDGQTTINFRDTSYSPTEGGYRPVEMMVEKRDNAFALHYYTEFSFQGPTGYAELAKSNDFDFLQNCLYSNVVGEMQLDAELGEVFDILATNAIAYFEMGAFDEVQVAHIDGRHLL